MKREQQGASLLSTVFVDYDNIYLSLKRKSEDAAKRFAKDAPLWLGELVSGRLITPTNGPAVDIQRRIVMNRCYGNPVPRRNSSDNSTDMNSFPFVRHHFLRAGFEVVDCPPLTAQLKNSSDIRMVMDVRDYLTHDTYFDEFIILSGDADFTPLLHRLRAHARRTVIFANDYTAAPYTAISDGEVRESDLITLLLDGRARTDAEDNTAVTASAQPALPAAADIELTRREIIKEVITAVRSAGQPVPLEALADRAVRTLGHDRTVGTAWGGTGSFRDLLLKGLPEDVQLNEQPPYFVFDAAREIAHRPEPERIADQRAPAQRKRDTRPEPAPRTEPAPRIETTRLETHRIETPRIETPRLDTSRLGATPVAAPRAEQPAQQPLDQRQQFDTRLEARSSERLEQRPEPARQPAAQQPAAPQPNAQQPMLGGAAMPERTVRTAATYVSPPQQPPQPMHQPQAPAAREEAPPPPQQRPAATSAPQAPQPAARPAADSGATAIQRSIARIHEACQAPPLSPPEYRALFDVMSQEINQNGLNGQQTLVNISQRASEMGVDARRDDVRFVLDVVSESDPWFDQGASPKLFAGRFRNFVVARCRSQGLALSADELDLIDAWFAGTPAPQSRAPARPQQSYQQLQATGTDGAPPASEQWYGAQQSPAPTQAAAPQAPQQTSHERFGASDDLGGDEFPRIVRRNLR